MTQQKEAIEKLTAEAIQNTFANMLSMETTRENPAALPADEGGHIAGSVGFAGRATGIIYLHAGIGFARLITSRMLGIPESEVEDAEMINDAFGELSNIVVGNVKSHLCDKGWDCTLTIPSIIRGQQLTVERSPLVLRSVLGFRHGEHHLLAEMLVKEPTK